VPSPIKYDDAASLYGPLRPIYLPTHLGFHDPAELGRALAAWRYNLSRDEVALLEHLADGLTSAEIAARMDVAEESTIKNRLKTIFSKLGVSKRVQAAKIPMDYGFAGKSVPLTRSNE